MTPSQLILINQVGNEAVEIFNVAAGHDIRTSPCTCTICRHKLDKVSQWLHEHDNKVRKDWQDSVSELAESQSKESNNVQTAALDVKPTVFAQESPGPRTGEEARQFHEGVLSGLTIYARESGHSTLKSDNELLRRLMDEQGQKTIESFNKIKAKEDDTCMDCGRSISKNQCQCA